MLALSTLLSTLAIGANVAVSVAKVEGVSSDTAVAIAGSLGAQIREHAGLSPIVLGPEWARCAIDQSAECFVELRAFAHASEVVLLKVYGGPTEILVLAERAESDAQKPKQASVELGLDASTWQTPLAKMAIVLYGEVPHLEPVEVQNVPAQDSSNVRVLPWAVLGAGVVCGGGALIVALTHRGGDRVAVEPLPMDDKSIQVTLKGERSSLALPILLAGAALGIGAGALMLAFDLP